MVSGKSVGCRRLEHRKAQLLGVQQHTDTRMHSEQQGLAETSIQILLLVPRLLRLTAFPAASLQTYAVQGSTDMCYDFSETVGTRHKACVYTGQSKHT
jgi:hypothetical protein